MTPGRAGHKILIVAADPLLAALVGTVVEFARYTAAFPQPDEPAASALERVKPLAAVLVDAGDANGSSDLFVSRARKLAIRVLLFGSRDVVAQRADWARRQQLVAFVLPDQLGELESALESLIPDASRPRAERDRRGNAERRPDGVLTFTDAKGVAWSVYDRRGPDRRNLVDRRFVSQNGEVLHCDITEQEARVTTLSVLADQLLRATPESS